MSASDSRLADILERIARELRDPAGITLPSLGDDEAVHDVAAQTPRQKGNVMETSLLLSTVEVGAMLNLHPRTVRRMWRAGVLPGAIQIGKSVRWRRSDIERWLEAQVVR